MIRFYVSSIGDDVEGYGNTASMQTKKECNRLNSFNQLLNVYHSLCCHLDMNIIAPYTSGKFPWKIYVNVDECEREMEDNALKVF